MSYGTEFKADVYINDFLPKSFEEVEGQIYELQEDKRSLATKLKMLAVARPCDVVDCSEGDAIYSVEKEVDSIIVDLIQTSENLTKLYLLAEHLRDTGVDITKLHDI